MRLNCISRRIRAVSRAEHDAAGDWAEWGGDPGKNMVSGEVGLPLEFSAGEQEEDSDHVDFATTKHCKWVVTLGSESYGTPTIASGRVIVGTNNEFPRNPKITGTRAW